MHNSNHAFNQKRQPGQVIYTLIEQLTTTTLIDMQYYISEILSFSISK